MGRRNKIDVEQIGWDEQIKENVSISGSLTLTGSFTQQGNQLKITSTGPTSLFLEADTDNVTESDTSFIKMTQDGQLITSYLGHVGLNSDEDPEGGTLTDSYKNALVISCYNSATSGTDQYSRIQMATDRKVRMTINDEGNVGIGEKAPTAKLHITDAAGGTLLRLDTATNQANDPQIYITGQGEDNGEGFALNYDNNTGDIRYDVFYVSGSHIWRLYQDTDDGAGFEGMRLTHEGNLGINTASPTDNLHVVGTSKFQGNTSVTGSFTVEGQTSIPSSKKVNEKAISLDGVDDRIVVGDYDEFTFSNASGDLPFSVSAWIYVNDVSTDIGTIVGKFTATADGNEWMFKQEQGYLHFYMYDFSKSGTGDQKRIIASSATVTSNTWHHVVVTCDGGSAAPGYTLYTDGSTTTGTAIFTNNYEQTRNTNAPLTIGAADLATGNRIFEDKIADVVIFNKELSSAEVTELYNSGNVKDIRSHSAYDNVISWWKMGDDLDSTSTDGIRDYVSGYHGTVENGASIVSEATLGSDNTGPISITSSGSLGVGIENPESTLHVAGRTKIDGDLIVSSNTTLEAPVTLNRDLVVTGSTTVQNLIIDTAVVGDLTISGSQLKVTSTGPTSLYLQADTDNVTETDTAFIKMTQDGQYLTGYLGYTPNDSQDPEGGSLTSGLANTLLLSNNNTFPGSPSRIHIATDQAVRIAIEDDGKVGIGTNAPATELHVNGALTLTEKSSDPSNPAEGNSVLWMSDGTGSGDDGDIMMKITAGGVTKTITLVDFSAS